MSELTFASTNLTIKGELQTSHASVVKADNDDAGPHVLPRLKGPSQGVERSAGPIC